MTDLSWIQELWKGAAEREIICVGNWWSQYDMSCKVLGTALRPSTAYDSIHIFYTESPKALFAAS
jgi:hypothetical protein